MAREKNFMVQKKKKKKKLGISKLIETKNNCKYLIRYLYEVIRPLVLILPKMSGYSKAFKDKDISLGKLLYQE